MLHANNITRPRESTRVRPALSVGEAKPKLLDQLREALRSRHYSRRTEQTYCHWVKRFIYFHICHTFRHSFATHLLESGYDIRTVQELLGHNLAWNLKVSYTDRNKEIRILCGSI